MGRFNSSIRIAPVNCSVPVFVFSYYSYAHPQNRTESCTGRGRVHVNDVDKSEFRLFCRLNSLLEVYNVRRRAGTIACK